MYHEVVKGLPKVGKFVRQLLCNLETPIDWQPKIPCHINFDNLLTTLIGDAIIFFFDRQGILL